VRWTKRPFDEPHQWFAWRPVWMWNAPDQYVWWESVWRVKGEYTNRYYLRREDAK
jgi:hypothetical protein